MLKSSLWSLYALCLACSLRSSFHSVHLWSYGAEFGFLAFSVASLDDVKRREFVPWILLVPQLDVRVVRVTFSAGSCGLSFGLKFQQPLAGNLGSLPGSQIPALHSKEHSLKPLVSSLSGWIATFWTAIADRSFKDPFFLCLVFEDVRKDLLPVSGTYAQSSRAWGANVQTAILVVTLWGGALQVLCGW